MKTLFDETRSYNNDGMQVSDMFESVFKKFLENIDASQYDPIELNWIFGNTIAMEMSRIYLDQACERHGI